MGRRDDLIAAYAADLRERCGVTPDIELLTKVTIGLGPAIYNADAALVSGTDPAELERVRRRYLVGKLGLAEDPDLDAAIAEAIAQYGASHRTKYRAVIYYLLAKRFGRESVYA